MNANPPDAGFVGRDTLLAEAGALLADGRHLTLSGLPGVGKSRLARTIAAGPAARGGAHVVDLAPLRKAALVPHAIAAAVGLDVSDGRPVRDSLLSHLDGREVLLVLDNAEHLADACQILVPELLWRCPGVRVLVTSRLPLRTAAERVLVVGPLSEEAAMELFLGRARAAAPDPVGTPLHDVLARSLCRRLDLLPLALELAAAKLGTLSLSELEHALDVGDDLAPPDCDPRRRPAHHHSLSTVLGRSHELCTPAQRLLWARLSVFIGAFTADDAQRVCGDRLLPDVAKELDRLAEGSLLHGRAGSFWLPVTVRTYGMRLLVALGESARQQARYRAWRDRGLP
ncbi:MULTISPECIES: AAA family ATPase [unclassified Streptomyces]|uniref:ATP-binding protein n=1 Tax=unclassified Streptomyces TaxID=2593676 RepID=UPI000DC4A990|nr:MULTISPECIES: AAA family ATPase [unclassified Streptomyces]MYT74879.1 AAA family ATPase [Streptomyces sp. SID8367]RAJ91866.1 putative ATPase [Streptomyces sp. PsTaAH-137]